MSFAEEVEYLADKVIEVCSHIQTEEGSKTALVLPLLGLLGYDVFNPKQIMAELTADIGVKKGEKVDYAIMSTGKPKLIIECKQAGACLDKASVSQLFRYYTALRVKFGVLTDGIIYKFYSDFDVPNRMDTAPFFIFNLKAYTHEDLQFLFLFRKGRLSGKMIGLIKECSKQRLYSIIQRGVFYTLEPNSQFVEDIKESLVNTGLSGVSKKELVRSTAKVILEESLKIVEKSREAEVLLPSLKSIMVSILGKDVEGSVRYRSTHEAIYIENIGGDVLMQVHTKSLLLEIIFKGYSAPKELRVIDDLDRHADIIRELITIISLGEAN